MSLVEFYEALIDYQILAMVFVSKWPIGLDLQTQVKTQIKP
jgi:hypothetical protein